MWTVDATYRRFSSVLFHDQCSLCVKFYLDASIYYISNHLICSLPSFSGISSLPLPFSASLHFNVDSHICASELERPLFRIIWCWRLTAVASKLFVKIYNFSHLVSRCHRRQHRHQTTAPCSIPGWSNRFSFSLKGSDLLWAHRESDSVHTRSSFLGIKAAGT